MPKAYPDDLPGYFTNGHRDHKTSDGRAFLKYETLEHMRVRNPNIDALKRMRKALDTLEGEIDAHVNDYLWRMLLTGYYLTLLPPDSVLARSRHGREWSVKIEGDEQWLTKLSPYEAVSNALTRRYPEVRVKGLPFLIDPTDLRNQRLLSLPYLLDTRIAPDLPEDADLFSELQPHTEDHTEAQE